MNLLDFSRPNFTARKSGFTIVELLIVVVVIAILAGITITAYSGIRSRASNSTVLADLNGAAKTLANEVTLNGTYPSAAVLASNGSPQAANNNQGLKSSGGNRYTYSLNTAVTPNTFCLAMVNASTNASYYVTSTDGNAQQGTCPTITNLVTNPSFEASASGVGWYKGPGGAASFNVTNSASAQNGTRIAYITWSTAPTSSGGIYYGTTGEPAVAGQTYTYSGYVKTTRAMNMQASMIWLNSSSTSIPPTSDGMVVNVQPGIWTRLSVTATAPANTAYVRSSFYATDSPSWQSGDQLQVDALMLTQGSTLYSYADGNTPGWSWSGTVNASTSSGLPN